MIRPHYVPLYQSACTSEKLADLQDTEARYFYLLLLTHCDSWGRCTAGVRVLTAKVWPLLGKTPADTERALADIERVGLIRRYNVNGEPFLFVPDWEEKAGRVGKVDRRGPSLCPEPPAVKPRTVRRTSPARGPEAQSDAGVEPPRARPQSDPIRAEPSREFSAAPPAANARTASPGSDPPPAAAPTPTPHQAIVTWFSDQYLLATGKRYAFEGGKDGRAVKELLARAGDGGVAEVLDRGAAFFEDPFHRSTAGLTLTKFLAAWNALAKASGAAPSSKPARAAAEVKAAADRAAYERDLERRWEATHTVEREVSSPLGGTVKRLVLDAKYPGHEAAERELRERGLMHATADARKSA